MFNVTPEEARKNVEARLIELEMLDGDGIARKLRAVGVKGRRGSPKECPVARYMNFDCRVSALGVRVGEDAFSVSRSIREFVGNFDSGMYPDLEI